MCVCVAVCVVVCVVVVACVLTEGRSERKGNKGKKVEERVRKEGRW